MREKRPGYWELCVFEGADPLTGRKKYRTRTFRGTKRQAQSALAVLVTEVDGGVVEPKKCTVAELLDAWLDHIEHVGRSPSTLYGYRRLVRQLPEGFLGQPIGKVTPKVLDDLYRLLLKQTSRKPATVLKFHSVLRAAFHQAVRWGWLDRNPVERAMPPRVEQVETVPPVVADVRVPEVTRKRRTAPAEPDRPGLAPALPKARRRLASARSPPPAGIASPRRRRSHHHRVSPARSPGHLDDPEDLQPPHAGRRSARRGHRRKGVRSAPCRGPVGRVIIADGTSGINAAVRDRAAKTHPSGSRSS